MKSDDDFEVMLMKMIETGWTEKHYREYIKNAPMTQVKVDMMSNEDLVLFFMKECRDWDRNVAFRNRLFSLIDHYSLTRQDYFDLINDKTQAPAFRDFLLLHIDRVLGQLARCTS